MARKKLRVGVLFGGRSGEHEISLRSALTVIAAMDPARYDVVPIGISRDGRWHLRADAIALLKHAAPNLRALGTGGIAVCLPPYPARDSLEVMSRNGARPSDQIAGGRLDVIFPILHGTYGEDGTVQGLLELAGVPYVGAGVLGSALGIDKDVQKRLLRERGMPVVPYIALTAAEITNRRGLGQIAGQLGFPLFVKPNALGSSIGITRVKSRAGLNAALREAFQYDRKVLLEQACEGREFECAVLGNHDPQASVIGEIVVSGRHRFYSYASKYIDPEGARMMIPADVPRAVSEGMRQLAVAAFETLGLRGMARVDFLARKNLDEFFINEVNTIPGFTTISMYPKLWEASGLKLFELIDRLIQLALAEHSERAALKFIYQPRRADSPAGARHRSP